MEDGANGPTSGSRGTNQPQTQLLLSEPVDLTRSLQSSARIVTSPDFDNTFVVYWLVFTQISFSDLWLPAWRWRPG
jgi:hypothetical protein